MKYNDKRLFKLIQVDYGEKSILPPKWYGEIKVFRNISTYLRQNWIWFRPPSRKPWFVNSSMSKFRKMPPSPRNNSSEWLAEIELAKRPVTHSFFVYSSIELRGHTFIPRPKMKVEIAEERKQKALI